LDLSGLRPLERLLGEAVRLRRDGLAPAGRHGGVRLVERGPHWGEPAVRFLFAPRLARRGLISGLRLRERLRSPRRAGPLERRPAGAPPSRCAPSTARRRRPCARRIPRRPAPPRAALRSSATAPARRLGGARKARRSPPRRTPWAPPPGARRGRRRAWAAAARG